MRPYEMMVLFSTDLDNDELEAQLDLVDKWIKDNEGEVVNVDHWGRRRMAYEIKDQRDAYYVVYQLNMPASAPVEVERNLRLTEDILRYLITRGDE